MGCGFSAEEYANGCRCARGKQAGRPLRVHKRTYGTEVGRTLSHPHRTHPSESTCPCEESGKLLESGMPGAFCWPQRQCSRDAF
jgi:hypothetical protein